jgi:transposase
VDFGGHIAIRAWAMMGLPSCVRIFLSSEPVDMRKGFDGLSSIVMTFSAELYSGHLFVFISKRRDRVKVLTWDKGGFVLWYKRLERGRFKLPKLETEQRTMPLDSGQLSMLLDGIDFSRVKRPKSWQPPKKDE